MSERGTNNLFNNWDNLVAPVVTTLFLKTVIKTTGLMI